MTLPAVPESFFWAQSPCGTVLKCRPLGTLAAHLFTTRERQLSGDSWGRIAQALQVDTVMTLTQVHGRDVVVRRRELARDEGTPRGDVLVSDDPGMAMVVRAADCVPLLLADSATGAVAAVHAGWRGTAAGAAAASVDALAREFGSKPQDLVVALGPSIGPCCYHVGPELVDAFAAAGHPRHLIDRWFSLGDRGTGTGDRTLRLDLPAANRDQLVLAGVPEPQIYPCGLCTAMHLDILTSYRAEKERAGRISGAIRCGTMAG